MSQRPRAFLVRRSHPGLKHEANALSQLSVTTARLHQVVAGATKEGPATTAIERALHAHNDDRDTISSTSQTAHVLASRRQKRFWAMTSENVTEKQVNNITVDMPSGLNKLTSDLGVEMWAVLSKEQAFCWNWRSHFCQQMSWTLLVEATNVLSWSILISDIIHVFFYILSMTMCFQPVAMSHHRLVFTHHQTQIMRLSTFLIVWDVNNNARIDSQVNNALWSWDLLTWQGIFYIQVFGNRCLRVHDVVLCHIWSIRLTEDFWNQSWSRTMGMVTTPEQQKDSNWKMSSCRTKHRLADFLSGDGKSGSPMHVVCNMSLSGANLDC